MTAMGLVRRVIPAFLVCLACGTGTPGTGEPEALRVRVRGEEFEWHIGYAGQDQEWGTADDVHAMQNLHIPERTPITVELASADYIYGFRLPDFDVNEPAIPGLNFRAEFEADALGTYRLLGNQMCGYAHESLLGQVIVHSQPGFDDWLQEANH